MTFKLGTEIKEISNAPEAIRAERLATAFRRVCKEITWNTRAKLHKNLHATPTATVSPITINQNTEPPHLTFTLTAVKSGETMQIGCCSFGVALTSSPLKSQGFFAKRNGDMSGLAAKMEKAVTDWLQEKAPGQPRASFDAPKP